MPADLAYFWGAESGEPVLAPSLFGRFLNLLPLFVDLFRRTTGDPAPDAGHLPVATKAGTAAESAVPASIVAYDALPADPREQH